jgi:hypothetical protein
VRGCFTGVLGDTFENGHDEPLDELKGGVSKEGFENHQDEPSNELNKNETRMLSEGIAHC